MFYDLFYKSRLWPVLIIYILFLALSAILPYPRLLYSTGGDYYSDTGSFYWFYRIWF